jgi:hypothetical protein
MPEKRDISKEILEYLRKHSEASDTLEGITEWWILSQRIHDEVRKVKEAVSSLVEQGWLVKIKGEDQRTRYRLNRERCQEINNLCKKKP